MINRTKIGAVALAFLFASSSLALAAGEGGGGGGGGADSGGGGGGGEIRSPAALPGAPSVYARAVRSIKAGDYRTGFELLRSSGATDANTLNYMGFASRKLGRLAEAQSYYERALAKNPNHVGALEYYGELSIQIGKPDQAKAFLARLERLCGRNCEEYRDLSKAIGRSVARN